MSTAARPLMLRLLSASTCAANRAGAIIRDVLKSGKLGVVEKGYDDPQTEADRRAQQCIMATLKSRFPSLTVIGEEEDVTLSEEEKTRLAVDGECQAILEEQCPPEYNDVREEDLMVWVDPLDGTKEFTEGFPEHVTVLVGVSLKGKAVAGVINQPFWGEEGRSVWGLIGLGARGFTPASCSAEGEGLVITVTRSHMSKPVQDTLDVLKPTKLVKAGGCGNKILKLLEGEVDAYVYPSIGTKKWDSCSGEAIVHSLGGRLTDILGNDLEYKPGRENYMNKRGLLVTMKHHDTILAKIPEHVREKFSAAQ